MKIRASSAFQAALCPWSVKGQQGVPDLRVTDEVRDSGNRIHHADAGAKVDLLVHEVEMLETLSDKRKKFLAEFSDGFEITETIRERGYEFRGITGHPDLVVRMSNAEKNRAIIIDSKCGFLEQPEPASSMQLRWYAYLVFMEHWEVDEIYATLNYARRKNPAPVHYTRYDLIAIETEIDLIFEAAERATAKDAKPSIDACRYCRIRATDRCPETFPTSTQLFKTPSVESLLSSLMPAQKGKLLDECAILEGNIKVARERLLAELAINETSVEGWKVGWTSGRDSIPDATAAFNAVSEYLSAEEFAACCVPGKTKITDALKAKLRTLPKPIKGDAAASLIKDLLAPVIVKGEGSPKLEKITPQIENI